MSSGFGGFIMGGGAVIFMAAILSSGEPEAKAGQPPVKVVTKVVEKRVPYDRAGKCMDLKEQGIVEKVSMAKHTEEGSKHLDSWVSLKMPNGFSRVCHYHWVDLIGVLKEGQLFNARGGERIM